MLKTHRSGRLYLTIIGFSLCLIGGLFIWLMMRSFIRAKEMTHWHQENALIVHSEVEKIDIPMGTSAEYRLDILFSYQFNGQHYRSYLYDLRGGMRVSDKEKIRQLTEKFYQGKSVICWVNPQHPETAVLRVDSRAAAYSLWFPGLFVLGGLGMIYGVWHKKTDSDIRTESVD
jgi:Protein of unknown function (DUF3592)